MARAPLLPLTSAPMNFEDLLLLLPVLLFSVVLHEYAHGWMARREGDDTAYMLGRLTLNPIPHIDLFGSVILPLLLILSRSGVFFAWAKPVPTVPRNYRNYRRGTFLVAIAGVTVNLILAFLLTFITIGLVYLSRALPGAEPVMNTLTTMARFGVYINLVLAFFNLIPVPPLDGSHLLYLALPPKLAVKYRAIGPYGILVVMLLLYVPSLRWILAPFFMPIQLLDGLADSVIRAWT